MCFPSDLLLLWKLEIERWLLDIDVTLVYYLSDHLHARIT